MAPYNTDSPLNYKYIFISTIIKTKDWHKEIGISTQSQRIIILGFKCLEVSMEGTQLCHFSMKPAIDNTYMYLHDCFQIKLYL